MRTAEPQIWSHIGLAITSSPQPKELNMHKFYSDPDREKLWTIVMIFNLLQILLQTLLTCHPTIPGLKQKQQWAPSINGFKYTVG
jgi:hypothetical protein